MSAPTHAYHYIVYETSGKFQAERSDGTPLFSAPQPTPDPVIQKALDQAYLGSNTEKGPGHVYIQTADPVAYVMSPSFTGLDVRSHTRLTMDPTTLIRVPGNYTGPVFRLRSDSNLDLTQTIIDGGLIQQLQGTKKCIGILLEAAGTVPPSPGNPQPGVFFNRVTNTFIEGAAVGIQLSVTGHGGWINGNSFDSVKMFNCGVFIDFEIPPGFYPHPTPGSGAAENVGIHRNHFSDVQCQSDAGLTVGVRNIRHVNNTFLDVKIWDVPGGSHASTIHPDATNTLIIGGIMTNRFVDNGQFTKILDEFHGLQIGNDTAIPAATKIGLSAPERLAFFGSAPAPQQAGSGSGQTAGTNYGATERNMLNAVYSALKAYGLIS